MYSNYALTNPDSMQIQILDIYRINRFQYNMIQSAYSIPNIVLCVYAGIFIDRHGVR